MEKKSDWSIMELYGRAFEIVKKYKVTWAFGLAVALATGGSFNGTGGSGGSSSNGKEGETTHQITQVLGEATTTPFPTIISHMFSQIPIGFYIFLGLEIFAVLGMAIVIGLIYHAWSEGSLTHSTNMANKNQKPTMSESSEKAFHNIKSLIWLSLVPGLFVALIVILAIFIPIVLYQLNTAVGIITGFIVAITILIGLILLALSLIWASRITILEETPAWESLKRGFKITKKKKWSMLLLGFLNMIISSAVIFAPILAGIIIFLIGVFLYFISKDLLPFLIITGTILFIGFIALYMIIMGTLTAWKNAVWTIAYDKIKGKYDGN